MDDLEPVFRHEDIVTSRTAPHAGVVAENILTKTDELEMEM